MAYLIIATEALHRTVRNATGSHSRALYPGNGRSRHAISIDQKQDITCKPRVVSDFEWPWGHSRRSGARWTM